MLFFLFACIGNLTYVLSIFAYEPRCEGRHDACAPGEAKSIYNRYILVNTSWLIGSMGTLFLDGAIFMQFFLYRVRNGKVNESGGEAETGSLHDDRPLLQRGESDYISQRN